MAEFRFATTGAARIRYLDSGATDRGEPPVVFVPGFTCVAVDYAQMPACLRRRTVVVELRGHGASTASGSRYDSDALAGDVGAVVDAVTDGSVHIMTFSRGTSYALIWALANRERVQSISIGDYLPEEITLTDEVASGVLDGRWRGTPVHQRLDRVAALATVRSARTQSFWEPLAQWGPPLLVVRSPTSPIIDDAAWARYRREFPSASLHEFPDSGHDIFRPDRTRYPKLVAEHITATTH